MFKYAGAFPLLSCRGAIRAASAPNDVVISSGGVSAGEEDHVLDALKREDATLEILKVAIRPGKPLTIGRVGGALFVGLPSNPYAAAITFLQIARPALRKAAGLLKEIDNWIPAVSGSEYPRKVGRREYLPVTWGRNRRPWSSSRAASGSRLVCKPRTNCDGEGYRCHRPRRRADFAKFTASGRAAALRLATHGPSVGFSAPTAKVIQIKVTGICSCAHAHKR